MEGNFRAAISKKGEWARYSTDEDRSTVIIAGCFPWTQKPFEILVIQGS